MGSDCIFSADYTMTEVLLRDSNNRFPEFETIDQVSVFGGYAVGFFVGRGSGFVIKIQNGKALIVTAAHIFIKEFKFYCFERDFYLGFRKYIAVPLKQQLNWAEESNFYEDPITGIRISIPEDFILCEIQLIGNENIVALEAEFNSAVNVGDIVQALGFIDNHTKADYGAPSATITEQIDLDQKIFCTICIVKFEGIVQGSGNLICATCSAVNGMSGGPLLKEINGRLKVVGLLQGSCPSLIHFYSAKIIYSIENPDFGKISELISLLEQKIECFGDSLFRKKIHRIIKDIKFALRNQLDYFILEDLFIKIYCKANKIEHESGNEIRYNVFVPVKFIQQYLI